MGQSLLTSIKSHPAAIDILCSVFNMDVIDALQDVLSCRFGYMQNHPARFLLQSRHPSTGGSMDVSCTLLGDLSDVSPGCALNRAV